MRKAVGFAFVLALTIVAATAWQNAPLFAEDADFSKFEAQPLIDNYELMDFMVDPVYEKLKEAASVEPTGRKGWRALYFNAYSMGELANLLFSRTDQEYMGTPEWNELARQMRQFCNNIGAATKAKDCPAR